MPIVFIGASLMIVINQLWREPIDALLGLGMVAIGAPIYYVTKLRLKPRRGEAELRY